MPQLTLREFPDAFYPLVVVTGDRREEKPKSKGDLLAYSVSSIDMTFLLHLGLTKCDIVTDKAFVLQDRKDLEVQFGDVNLLIIGSPAVNLLARQLNAQGAFRFDIHADAQRDIIQHEQIIDRIKFDHIALLIYKAMFERGLRPEQIMEQHFVDYPDRTLVQNKCDDLYADFMRLKLSERQWKSFIHNFDRPGIIDSVDQRRHAVVTTGYNDFGLICVSPNPYSSSGKVAISVAGIHGIATAHGVKLLSTAATSFAERPCGGVYEVQFLEYGSWSMKLRNAQVKWQTSAYASRFPNVASVMKLANQGTGYKRQRAFGFFISCPYNRNDKAFATLTEELGDICERYFSRTETAYSLKTSGRGMFPEVIEKQIQGSYAIIHVLNGFKPGVLFEIGLSIGLQKQAYLVWDRGLDKPDYFPLPEAIDKVNVIELDSSDSSEFYLVVAQQIIDGARALRSDAQSVRAATASVIKAFPRRVQKSRAYRYCSPVMSRYGANADELLRNEFQLSTLAESELRAGHFLEKHAYGIATAGVCIFMIEPTDRNGLILLGMARALKKEAVLFAEENVSMWKGAFVQLGTTTAEVDLQKGLRAFLDQRKRAARSELTPPKSAIVPAPKSRHGSSRY